MENSANVSQSIKHKKKSTSRLIKPAKLNKGIYSTIPGKFSNKSKTQKKTGENSENSLIGPSKTGSSKLIHKNNTNSSNHEKLSSVFSKFPLDKTHEKSKTRHLSGNSNRSSKKKEKFSGQVPKDKKITLKQKILIGIENNSIKAVPRPAYLKAKDSRDLTWTPEQVEIKESKKVSTISNEKKKNSEVCNYIKRFSLEDFKKKLYTDNDVSKISFDSYKKPSSNSFISEINQDCLEIEKFDLIKKESEISFAFDEDFKSPKNMFKARSSENRKAGFEEQGLGCKEEGKAPRLTLVGFESPGSFNFSISSCSSYEDCDYGDACAGKTDVEPRHIECQTEVPNTKFPQCVLKCQTQPKTLLAPQAIQSKYP